MRALRRLAFVVPWLTTIHGCTAENPTAPTFALVVTTTSLPAAVEHVAYAPPKLSAAGGEGTRDWTIASGSLPSGLSLSGSGEITGMPDVAGTSAFTVRVTSSDGQSAQRALQISVYAPLEATTTPLADGMAGVAYGPLGLQATGGNGVYTWRIVAGSLPSGLSLSPGGVIVGTPSAVGSANFTVEVTSGNGQTAQQVLSIDVRAFLGITTSSLPFGIEDLPYGPISLAAVGGDGSEVWSVIGGSLPSGLTLAGSGISGTPDIPGRADFIVRVSTTDGRSAQQALSIDVHGTLVVTTTLLPGAVANVVYGPALLTATGGVGPNTWTAVSALPAGLALGTNGALTGTTNVVGTFDLTVQVANADGQVAQRVISFTVAPQPVLLASERCADFPPYALVTFEDANLELAVRSAIGLAPGEQLTCAIAAGLTELDQVSGSERGIVSLVGMQNLVGLQTIWLASNLITDISPLSELVLVDEIHLQHNSIVDVSPVAGLTALTILSFWDNEVVDISPLAGLTQLTFLQLAENQITDVSAVAGLVNLTFLRLYQNFNLVDITPILNNPGLGPGDELRIMWTMAPCNDLAVLVQRGVAVYSEYDPTGLVPWNELCP
ncbi:MAG: putative Ig domain-containing protein [Gemmatimonadaceae bacterium]|nr:putative Ig domain-containing protein [Gemmatimonadaceae bacterium]